MDFVGATMAGILLAREIRQLYAANTQFTEEELAILITKNLLSIEKIKAVIREEMAKYEVN